jgi:hypothetical protein
VTDNKLRDLMSWVDRPITETATPEPAFVEIDVTGAVFGVSSR